MVTAIIQARVSATRLFNKVFADISGKPLIWHVVNRLRHCRRINKIVIATTVNPFDDSLEEWSKVHDVLCFRGSEQDVLGRYYEAALQHQATTIVRITADDPFKDPEIIDAVIDAFFSTGVDFAYNNNPPSFPEGLDTEVFSFAALKKAAEGSRDPFEREHVTQYFYRNPQLFGHFNLQYKEDISHLRWTIDTAADLEMAREIYRHLFREGELFRLDDILQLLSERPSIANINQSVKRSHMYAAPH